MRSPSLPVEDAKLTLSLGLGPLTLQIIALSKIRRFCDIMPREIKILSFGRAKGPQTLEVDVFKATPTTRLGLTLQPPEDETVAGVVIAHIDANAPLREAKKLLPGDIVTSVNCVPVASLSAVSAQIQQASGVLRFEVLRRPLPAGWRAPSTWSLRARYEFAIGTRSWASGRSRIRTHATRIPRRRWRGRWRTRTQRTRRMSPSRRCHDP